MLYLFPDIHPSFNAPSTIDFFSKRQVQITPFQDLGHVDNQKKAMLFICSKEEYREQIKNNFFSKFEFGNFLVLTQDKDTQIHALTHHQFFLNTPLDSLSDPIENDIFCLQVHRLYQMLETQQRISQFMVDSFQMSVVQSRLETANHEIEDLNHELLELSRVDYLTKLLNRRALIEAGNAEFQRATRVNENLQFFKIGDNSRKINPIPVKKQLFKNLVTSMIMWAYLPVLFWT